MQLKAPDSQYKCYFYPNGTLHDAIKLLVTAQGRRQLKIQGTAMKRKEKSQCEAPEKFC